MQMQGFHVLRILHDDWFWWGEFLQNMMGKECMISSHMGCCVLGGRQVGSCTEYLLVNQLSMG